MAFDTFDEGIALGGLRSKHEIKVLMCYLFNSVKDKMSESVITEAIREYELANFFEVKAAFDELKRSENLAEDEIVDGEQTYRLTDNGKLVAEQLESTLAYSVKEKALRCAVELLAERKTLRRFSGELPRFGRRYGSILLYALRSRRRDGTADEEKLPQLPRYCLQNHARAHDQKPRGYRRRA